MLIMNIIRSTGIKYVYCVP